MTIDEIKAGLKKDPSQTYLSPRKIGVVVTWLLLKSFPSIKANYVTLSMLPLNLLAAILMYYSITSMNYFFLIIPFLISILTYILDSVDGNIARLKQDTTIRGVFFDRLVHNISYPVFFLTLGFAFYQNTNQILYLIVFTIIAIASELSPLDISQKDVEALFIRQALKQKTNNYDFSKHASVKIEKLEKHSNKNKKVIKLIKTFLVEELIYLVIMLDVIIFDEKFFLTTLYGILYISAKLLVRLNIKKWEENLTHVLTELNTLKKNGI